MRWRYGMRVTIGLAAAAGNRRQAPPSTSQRTVAPAHAPTGASLRPSR
jgi:hypothetical protein